MGIKTESEAVNAFATKKETEGGQSIKIKSNFFSIVLRTPLSFLNSSPLLIALYSYSAND